MGAVPVNRLRAIVQSLIGIRDVWRAYDAVMRLYVRNNPPPTLTSCCGTHGEPGC